MSSCLTHVARLICFGSILLFPFESSAQQITLKHSYTFDDGQANDVVGRAHGIIKGNGTVKDGKFVTSAQGQYLELPAGQIKINTYRRLTLEACLTSGPENGGYTMFSYFGSKTGVNGMDYIFQSLINGGVSKTAISCYNTSQPSWTAETHIKAHPLQDGKPHHVVTTFDDKTILFYIDGMLVGSITNEAFPKNIIANLGDDVAYLSKGGFDEDQTWLGSIDQFNIYEGIMDREAVAKAAGAFLPGVDLTKVPGIVPRNNMIVDQTGEFDQAITGAATFFAELTPTEDDGNNRVDELLVFSDVPMADWYDFATMVRFSGLSGYVDVFDDTGEKYDVATQVPVEIGQVYQCWISVDVPSNTYSVFVKTNDAKAPVQICSKARFRKKVSSLQRWSLLHNKDVEDDAAAMKAFSKVDKIGAYPTGYVPSTTKVGFTIANSRVPKGAKVIDDPAYDAAFAPMKLKKLVCTDSTTELYFHLPYAQGWGVVIPKESHITEVESKRKLYIKRSEGIQIGSPHFSSAKGYQEYKLVFPAIAGTTKDIDYHHVSQDVNWSIYNISTQPGQAGRGNPFSGNWFNTKSGDWELSILKDVIIYDSKVWTCQRLPKANNGVLELSGSDGRLSLPYSYKKGKLSVGPAGSLKILSKEASYANVPAPTNPPPFKSPVLKMDTAVFKGYLYGYHPRMGVSTATLYLNNILDADQETYLIAVEADGSFSVKVPLAYPSVPYLRMEHGAATVMLSPGEETFVLFDLSRKTLPVIMGANARISLELSREDLDFKRYDYSLASSKVLDMSAPDFRAYCLQIQQRDLRGLDSAYKAGIISHRYHQYMQKDIAVETARNILHYHYTYEGAYRSKHRIPANQQDVPVKVNRPRHSAYYDFIDDDLVNSEISVLTASYDNFINAFQYSPVLENRETVELYDLLASLSKMGISLSEDEKQLLHLLTTVVSPEYGKANNLFFEQYGSALDQLITANQELLEAWRREEKSHSILRLLEYIKRHRKDLPEKDAIFLSIAFTHFGSPLIKKVLDFEAENADRLTAVRSKYTMELKVASAIHEAGVRERLMLDSLQIQPGWASDFMLSKTILNSISNQMTPLNDEALDYVTSYFKNPFVGDYVRSVNQATINKIANNKKQGGYVVHSKVAAEADRIFDEIVGRFKGKVVYVDFWATWCGPCRSNMARHKPMKDELKKDGKDVVFVYITNHSSSETTYNNLIPTIGGEHFRVDQDQWNYLCEKFQISGIPHYALVNRKGEVVDPDAPREPDVLKTRFDELLMEK